MSVSTQPGQIAFTWTRRRRELGGERAHEPEQAGLRGAVGRVAGDRDPGEDRCDHDDVARLRPCREMPDRGADAPVAAEEVRLRRSPRSGRRRRRRSGRRRRCWRRARGSDRAPRRRRRTPRRRRRGRGCRRSARRRRRAPPPARARPGSAPASESDAPSAASRSAIALPIPRPPPVTTTCLPASASIPLPFFALCVKFVCPRLLWVAGAQHRFSVPRGPPPSSRRPGTPPRSTARASDAIRKYAIV